MKEKLQQLIAEGKTCHAIKELLEITVQIEDHEFRQEVILLSSRYELYERNRHQGTSSAEFQSTFINRITQALLKLIEQLPDDPGLILPERKFLGKSVEQKTKGDQSPSIIAEQVTIYYESLSKGKK